MLQIVSTFFLLYQTVKQDRQVERRAHTHTLLGQVHMDRNKHGGYRFVPEIFVDHSTSAVCDK